MFVISCPMTSSIIDILPSDILHLVCEGLSGLPESSLRDLGSLASTCKLFRAIALPLLFRTVAIRNESLAEGQLQGMLASQSICRYIRRFNFVLRVETALTLAWCPALIQLLISMDQLQEFRFDAHIDPDDREAHSKIQDLFLNPDRTPRFQLRSVHFLATDECAMFLLAVCPEVSYMALRMIARCPHDGVSLCGEWPVAQRVQYLQLEHEGIGDYWENMVQKLPDVCKMITTSFPNVKKFVFEGFCRAQLVLPQFSALTQVETLAVGDLSYLGLGFNPPRCGHAYRGARGKELRRTLEISHKAAWAQLNTTALSVYPRLRRLWAGGDEMCDFTRLRRRDDLDALEFKRVDFITEWEISEM